MNHENDDHALLLSPRAFSGYKHVIHDARPAARKYPWSASIKGHRSAGFATSKEAARYVLKWLSDNASKTRPVRTALRTKSAPSRTARSSPIKKKRVERKHCAQAQQKRQKKTKETAAAVIPPVSAAILPPAAASASPAWTPSTWMSKDGVNFDVEACDLFGQRIVMMRKGQLQHAVIKTWQPCSNAPFGIVFDAEPDSIVYENLLRKGRTDWKIVPWEGDLLDTADLRPMCPMCGHPLGVGCDAWTKCTACGSMEPGAMAAEVLTRVRSDDPYRRM